MKNLVDLLLQWKEVKPTGKWRTFGEWEGVQSTEHSKAFFFFGMGKDDDQRTWTKFIWPKKGHRLGAADACAWQEMVTSTMWREEPRGSAPCTSCSFGLDSPLQPLGSTRKPLRKQLKVQRWDETIPPSRSACLLSCIIHQVNPEVISAAFRTERWDGRGGLWTTRRLDVSLDPLQTLSAAHQKQVCFDSWCWVKSALSKGGGLNCSHSKSICPPGPMNVNVALGGKWDLPDIRKDVKGNPPWM